MSKLFKYASAVRGYHYYRQYWQPEESQTLDCAHEKDNPFDIFAIKVMDRNSGSTVGHLPMENSRAIKFLLDRGARVFATLTSTNYCVSPLVQGGLEIPCRVELFMSLNVKNNELIDIFRKYVDVLYYEREDSNTVGSFVEKEEDVSERQSTHKIKKSPKINQSGQKSGSIRSTSKASHKDIRSFLCQNQKRPPQKTDFNFKSCYKWCRLQQETYMYRTECF